jgi:hypothetical protein
VVSLGSFQGPGELSIPGGAGIGLGHGLRALRAPSCDKRLSAKRASCGDDADSAHAGANKSASDPCGGLPHSGGVGMSAVSAETIKIHGERARSMIGFHSWKAGASSRRFWNGIRNKSRDTEAIVLKKTRHNHCEPSGRRVHSHLRSQWVRTGTILTLCPPRRQ